MMTAKEVLKLDSVTSNFYTCHLCKAGNNVDLIFDGVSLTFESCLIFKCGYPNEEVYLHYDYYTQGPITKHCLYEIQESQWIQELNEMNKAHPRHTDELFKGERHFIILFEDEVLECISSSYKITFS